MGICCCREISHCSRESLGERRRLKIAGRAAPPQNRWARGAASPRVAACVTPGRWWRRPAGTRFRESQTRLCAAAWRAPPPAGRRRPAAAGSCAARGLRGGRAGRYGRGRVRAGECGAVQRVPPVAMHGTTPTLRSIPTLPSLHQLQPHPPTRTLCDPHSHITHPPTHPPARRSAAGHRPRPCRLAAPQTPALPESGPACATAASSQSPRPSAQKGRGRVGRVTSVILLDAGTLAGHFPVQAPHSTPPHLCDRVKKGGAGRGGGSSVHKAVGLHRMRLVDAGQLVGPHACSMADIIRSSVGRQRRAAAAAEPMPPA